MLMVERTDSPKITADRTNAALWAAAGGVKLNPRTAKNMQPAHNDLNDTKMRALEKNEMPNVVTTPLQGDKAHS